MLPLLLDLCARLGPPVFAGTLVACLLSGGFTPIHGVLMGVGVLLIAMGLLGRYGGRTG